MISICPKCGGNGCNKILPKLTLGMFSACGPCNGSGYIGRFNRGFGRHRLSDQEWERVKGEKFDPLEKLI
jgi:DnaJ-class molecular chaperone